MDKLKFWGVAVGFIAFLWLLSPDPEEPKTGTDFTQTEATIRGQDGLSIPDPLSAPQTMSFKTGKVPITTRGGTLPLVLGFAHTYQQQSAGLMHYRIWPKYMHGLLFLFEQEDTYSMWMKNTYLPLDIAFIDRNGRIVEITTNTTPESQLPIKAPKPVLAVLEIPAGSAKKWNLQKGDQLRLKYFRSSLPASR